MTSEINSWGQHTISKTVEDSKQCVSFTLESQSQPKRGVARTEQRDMTRKARAIFLSAYLRVTKPPKEGGGKDGAEGHDKEGKGNLFECLP